LFVWGVPLALLVPNCLKKRAGHTGVSYSGYTIRDYLTLGKVSIFAASGKLAPRKKKQEARIRAGINSKSTATTCEHVRPYFFEFHAAMQQSCFFLWGSNNPHAANGNFAK